MAKHKQTDGDSVLEAAKARRAEEVAALRDTDPMFADVVPADWQARDLGFPPYLKMEPGKMFRGVILRRDDRDEFVDQDTGEVRPFVRYHIQLTAPAQLECRRGPADERGEPVVVQAGQIFTIGDYKQLQDEMRALAGLEMALVCRKKGSFKDRRSGDPRTLLHFQSYISPEVARMLISEADADREALRTAYREARLKAARNSFLFQSEPAKEAAEVAAE